MLNYCFRAARNALLAGGITAAILGAVLLTKFLSANVSDSGAARRFFGGLLLFFLMGAILGAGGTKLPWASYTAGLLGALITIILAFLLISYAGVPATGLSYDSESRDIFAALMTLVCAVPAALIQLIPRYSPPELKRAIQGDLLREPAVTAFYELTRTMWASDKLTGAGPTFKTTADVISHWPPIPGTAVHRFLTAGAPLEGEFLIDEGNTGYLANDGWYVLTSSRLFLRRGEAGEFVTIPLRDIAECTADPPGAPVRLALTSGETFSLQGLKNAPAKEKLALAMSFAATGPPSDATSGHSEGDQREGPAAR